MADASKQVAKPAERAAPPAISRSACSCFGSMAPVRSLCCPHLCTRCLDRVRSRPNGVLEDARKRVTSRIVPPDDCFPEIGTR